jgi:RNA polymerase sigma factor (sigma-70 family)
MTEAIFPFPSGTVSAATGGNTRRQERDRLVELAYGAHAASLARHLTAVTRDASVAEDLTQEAFLRLAIDVDRGRIPDNLGAWLFRVGANLATSRGRRISVAERRRFELVRSDVAPSPEALAIDADEAHAVRGALAELNQVDRQALLLAAHGYRGPEIAELIGRTEGATRTLLCRARSKLRGHLVASGVQA